MLRYKSLVVRNFSLESLNANKVSPLSRFSRLSKLSRPGRFSNLTQRGRRWFSEEAKTASNEAKEGAAKTATPPPPPPPPSSGGSGGMWILLTAALAGGGYYFKDEISGYLGMNKGEASDESGKASSSDSKQAVGNVPETKKEIQQAEDTLKKVAPQELKKQVKASDDKSSQASAANTTVEVDWKGLREDIVNLLDSDDYDDGSYGPVLVRLAWHSAGTYDKNTKKGGSEGAAMRFHPEANWGANAGLDVARALLEPIKAKHPGLSYSDLWSFAGTVAIEEMGGPEMKWRPGRKDYVDGQNILPDGLLPDADGREHTEFPAQHLREIFGRMGFNDQEIVCLSGAHALGRCHEDRSGFWGPWTRAPTTFSNEYFRLLLEEVWSNKVTHKGGDWKGPKQFEDPTGDLMMLPTDLCLVHDAAFKKYVEIYAKDEEKFLKDFAKAWIKLQELGVRKFHGWRRYIFFGPRE